MTLFFFNDTAPTEIYTLSLHDALPISSHDRRGGRGHPAATRGAIGTVGGRGRAARQAPQARAAAVEWRARRAGRRPRPDRKSTRLYSSHANISDAGLFFKKKNTNLTQA